MSLRGVVDDALEQGEPLQVTVRVEASRQSGGTTVLAPASGTWADAIAVELVAAGGSTVLARAAAVGRPDLPHAMVDRARVAGGMWMFPPGTTQRLALGDYRVRTRLVLRTGEGWQGEVAAEEVPLRIVAAAMTPERVAARAVVQARAALDANALEDAARGLDGLLAKTPDDFAALCLRAEIAERAGNLHAAMVCVNRAALLISREDGGLPPLGFGELRARIMAARLAQTGPVANPPAWSWPPANVLKLPEKALSEAQSPRTEVPPLGVAKSQPVVVERNAAAPVAVSSAVTAAAPTPKITVPVATLPVAPTVPAAAGSRSVGVVLPAADLDDKKIRADAAGQWAASATASSQYGTPRYAPAQATGAPSVPLGMAGDNPDAWCPAKKDEGIEWLEVTFAKPVSATEVRVLQNNTPGAIAKLEAIEPNGTVHVWWEGKDPYIAPAVREIAWFVVRVPKTAYAVAKVKITLNLAATASGWKQIDAVQLVAAP
ncbi:MAG: hypothetical protein Q8N18_00175 [Opitutaceae bacterium]|nr:hypothetical protein [Opitutaceae bacterium]